MVDPNLYRIPPPAAARPRVLLRSIGLHHCDPWWSLGPERTREWSDLDLWVLLAGQGHVETPEGRRELRPGACLIMRGGEDYRFSQNPRQRFHHWFAHFVYAESNGGAPAPLPRRFRQLDDPQLVAALLERVERTWRADDGHCHLWLDAALLEVERQDTSLLQPTDPWAAQLSPMLTALRADPAAAASVAQMAAELGLSTDHFTRVFRRTTGQTPRDYLVAARFERARHLLRDSTLTIARIADSCGFADPAFFGRHFRTHHGLSPGAWRERCRRGVG